MRYSAPPLIECFAQGYGVVAVSVIDATPAATQYTFDVRCHVELLVAQAITGQPLPLKAGDEFTLPIMVGYSCPIESLNRDFKIRAGSKYILTLKFDAFQIAYSQVPGANSVRNVQEFNQRAIHCIRSIRDLAAVNQSHRIDLALAALVDPLADLELRVTARNVLRKMNGSPFWSVNRDATIELLRRQWSEATITQGFGDVMQGYNDVRHLDETLQVIDPTFTKESDMRLGVWFRIIFTPADVVDADADHQVRVWSDRWNFHMYQLRALGLESPTSVVPRIISEINDSRWPVQFRVGLAKALQGIYQMADAPNEDCNQALQLFYPVAFAEAEPWSLRLLGSLVAAGMREPMYQIKRQFVADQATWDAMETALNRMHGPASAVPRVGEAFIAERELKEAMKSRPN